MTKCKEIRKTITSDKITARSAGSRRQATVKVVHFRVWVRN